MSPLWPCLFLLTPWSYHSSCKVVFPTDVRGGETTQKAPLTCRIVPSVGCTSTTRGAFVRSKPQSHLLLQGLGSKRTSKRCIMHSLFSNALSCVPGNPALALIVLITRFELPSAYQSACFSCAEPSGEASATGGSLCFVLQARCFVTSWSWPGDDKKLLASRSLSSCLCRECGCFRCRVCEREGWQGNSRVLLVSFSNSSGTC